MNPCTTSPSYTPDLRFTTAREATGRSLKQVPALEIIGKNQ
jgi:hypothetical protein